MLGRHRRTETGEVRAGTTADGTGELEGIDQRIELPGLRDAHRVGARGHEEVVQPQEIGTARAGAEVEHRPPDLDTTRTADAHDEVEPRERGGLNVDLASTT